MKTHPLKSLLVGLFLLVTLSPVCGFSQPASPDDQKIANLESRISHLEGRSYGTDAGAAVWLYGAFCALWAQNTRRNPWLWFFLGVFFSVITVLVMLKKNSEDKQGSP